MYCMYVCMYIYIYIYVNIHETKNVKFESKKRTEKSRSEGVPFVVT